MYCINSHKSHFHIKMCVQLLHISKIFRIFAQNLAQIHETEIRDRNCVLYPGDGTAGGDDPGDAVRAGGR